MCSKCNMSFKPVKFTFGDDVEWGGFDEGGTWNGWNNVTVTREVYMKIRRDMIKLMGMAQANQDNPIVSKQQHYVSLANGWAATIVEKTNQKGIAYERTPDM